MGLIRQSGGMEPAPQQQSAGNCPVFRTREQGPISQGDPTGAQQVGSWTAGSQSLLPVPQAGKPNWAVVPKNTPQ